MRMSDDRGSAQLLNVNLGTCCIFYNVSTKMFVNYKVIRVLVGDDWYTLRKTDTHSPHGYGTLWICVDDPSLPRLLTNGIWQRHLHHVEEIREFVPSEVIHARVRRRRCRTESVS